MLRRILPLLLLLWAVIRAPAQITIAQISDTHLGLKRAPDATSNLRRTVEMVNERHPDAVIVSGDIGENPEAWREARAILNKSKAPVFYVPGNHDDNASRVERYRGVFGKDYYEFKVKNATFIALDSQLLGNFDVFKSHQIMPLSTMGLSPARCLTGSANRRTKASNDPRSSTAVRNWGQASSS